MRLLMNGILLVLDTGCVQRRVPPPPSSLYRGPSDNPVGAAATTSVHVGLHHEGRCSSAPVVRPSLPLSRCVRRGRPRRAARATAAANVAAARRGAAPTGRSAGTDGTPRGVDMTLHARRQQWWRWRCVRDLGGSPLCAAVGRHATRGGNGGGGGDGVADSRGATCHSHSPHPLPPSSASPLWCSRPGPTRATAGLVGPSPGVPGVTSSGGLRAAWAAAAAQPSC